MPISRGIRSTMVKGEYGQPLALDVLVMPFGFWNPTGSFRVGLGSKSQGLTVGIRASCYLVPGGARDLRLVDGLV